MHRLKSYQVGYLKFVIVQHTSHNIFLGSFYTPECFDRRILDQNLGTMVGKIGAWMERCNKHECRKSNGVLHSRLLGLGSTIPLCEISSKIGPYTALSHCWGGHPSLPTTLETLDQRLQEVPWESLGRTYQDAIRLTRRLSINFL